MAAWANHSQRAPRSVPRKAELATRASAKNCPKLPSRLRYSAASRGCSPASSRKTIITIASPSAIVIADPMMMPVRTASGEIEDPPVPGT